MDLFFHLAYSKFLASTWSGKVFLTFHDFCDIAQNMGLEEVCEGNLADIKHACNWVKSSVGHHSQDLPWDLQPVLFLSQGGNLQVRVTVDPLHKGWPIATGPEHCLAHSQSPLNVTVWLSRNMKELYKRYLTCWPASAMKEMKVPSPETFKVSLDGALSNLIRL